MDRVDTRQLEYFVTVAQERSFTQAAARLNAVQSTVSAGVAALEKDLRYAVLTRSTRRVELTPQGAELLPIAERILADERKIRSIGGDQGETLRGRIRIGTLTSLEWLDLPGRLGAFHRQHPDVKLSLAQRPRGSSDIARDLRAGRLDVGLVGFDAAELADLAPIVLQDTPFVAMLPPTHPLATETTISLAALARDGFVDVPTGFGNRTMVDRYLAAQGVRRSVLVEVPDLTTVPDYVRAGLGVAVVPRPSGEARGVVIRGLAEPLRWQLCLVSSPKARDNEAVRQLLRVLGRRELKAG
ncbi:LysR family transcriptional regulator [Flexivirga endophytica]|uniref:LysR family transcriptional regulator n=1 Tax=Flexivirga endophytica TaxID=1849103 RepID=A0A916T4S9_9MICO|nr:LysR family transcriptional regulator [Flexivirga endophytica]GHB52844.1 LysR family transcriptional regulator [Flexivirga endophytica]